MNEYRTTRKLQEQGGSFLITLPKFWVQKMGLKEGDQVTVVVNDILKIVLLSKEEDQP